ncbi:DUF551 domain-containing protein [Serratia marcescens]|uniref:DUF551 domain-containing protein n=1 Tax=Serratia marcescens TaxID=615 RepID=UPI0011AB8A32|nr:DUF551 domain-containing protein [Serratia marcescens]
MTLTTEQLSAVETTKEFRALLKYMRAIAKAEPESVKEKFELEEGLWRYASQKAIKAIVGHIDALEFALAANREAQPVACDIERIKRHALPAGECPRQSQVVLLSSLQRLLTAPPAPAVPDAVDYSDLDATSQDREVIEAIAECKGWNACRAAMLAQPVSSGYKLPESWIPCSEQTPVADGAYWCWFGKEKPSVIQQRVCIWNDRNHEWCDSSVTHWMPLPAVPEV